MDSRISFLGRYSAVEMKLGCTLIEGRDSNGLVFGEAFFVPLPSEELRAIVPGAEIAEVFGDLAGRESEF